MKHATRPDLVSTRNASSLPLFLGFALVLLASPFARATLTRDTSVSVDQTGSTISNTSFSTTSPNELLLAFISTDYLSGANTTVTGASGGGLSWTLVRRTNAQSGTSEIWRAFASVPLTNVTVSATLSQSVGASMMVMSFVGADTSGTGGSGAIGATGTGNSTKGAPSASLTTTRAGSWVVGVDNDYDNAIARTPGANQAVVHQTLTSAGDTYWVQIQSAPTVVAWHHRRHQRHRSLD